MASKHIKPLTRDERSFVGKALLAAEIPTLLKGRRMAPEGAASIAGEYAVALLAVYRRLSKGTSR